MSPLDILTPLVLALAFIGFVACLRLALVLTLIGTAGVAAGMWALFGEESISSTHAAIAAGVVLAAFIVSQLGGRKLPKQSRGLATKPQKATADIVVDGTNVMFWSGEAELVTLQQVVAQLNRKGMMPFVFLDASSRHHLGDKSLDEAGFAKALGLKKNRVMVCPARTEADAFLLQFAKERRLPVVSNDRFGDRAQMVKGLKLIKGGVAGGKPMLHGI